MGIKIRVITDPLEARGVCKALREISGESHPVLKDFEFRIYHGALGLILEHNKELSSLHCSYLGKRKTGKFEPYVNWYTSYTVPSKRRQGFATALWNKAQDEAEAAGCRRVKSLAGSPGGVWLHYSLKQSMWGKLPGGALLVDSALSKYKSLYTPEEIPRNVRYNKFFEPMTKKMLIEAIESGLQYPSEGK